METKICSKCGRELTLDRFEPGRNQCRDCRNARRNERRNTVPGMKERRNDEAKARQKIQTAWLHSLKTPCIVCGESEPVCIDFHHIDPSTKDFTISKHTSSGKNKLLIEIQKCVCLCANCHRKLHYGLINLEDYLNKSSPCPTEESVTE